jgi:hypothetical protein
MKKLLIFNIMIITAVLTSSPVTAVSPQIVGRMEIINNNIIVNLRIDNVTELDTPIKSGVEKEVIITVELLRDWKYWPDEFIASKKITKAFRYDNLREKYRASHDDGVMRREKYFKDYASMKKWVFTVKNVNLAHVKQLDPDDYYIRIVVESRSIEELPLLGFLMHFIPEVEMSLAKESEPFYIGDTE